MSDPTAASPGSADGIGDGALAARATRPAPGSEDEVRALCADVGLWLPEDELSGLADALARHRASMASLRVALDGPTAHPAPGDAPAGPTATDEDRP